MRTANNSVLVNRAAYIAKGLLSPSVTDRVEALQMVAASKDASYTLKLQLLLKSCQCKRTRVAADEALFEVNAKAWIDRQREIGGVKPLKVNVDSFGVVHAA